ncbi:alpha/beta hydrolase [Kitasatospora sp. NPDC048296]|uniref:alpha/beta hydrolase n=1 Tax=Kitasatospora sp. NPDC048296 TaxID=3364048 RepID=UPI00372267DB
MAPFDGRRNRVPSALQCSTLKVPLDYTAPGTGTLDVAVVRNPAVKPDQRIGSLVLNPGGPGGSGVAMVKGGPKRFDGPLHDRYDRSACIREAVNAYLVDGTVPAAGTRCKTD